MTDETPPAWRLPVGVNPSLWRYAHTPRLVEEEDHYFLDNPLFERDALEVDARFREPGRVIDLGCGSGRHAIRLARRGFRVVAAELSQSMLVEVARRAELTELKVDTVRLNLCRLECFPDGSFDYAVSMFSTLGMIRTPRARQRALSEAARVLKVGGRLALHAHNLLLNLRNNQGRRWLLGQMPAILRGADNAADRNMTYRGVPGMEVHLYRWGELKREIAAAGLRIEETLALNEIDARPIAAPWLLPSIRAGGWLLFCRRT
jgi:SAM-dependent methyltransferase